MPAAAEEAGFDYARTVALSDGVFAIALTLLVLTISVPTVHGSESALTRQLLHRRAELGSYALSFTVIAFLWVRHHGFFRTLGRIDGRLTTLNLVFLGFVAFLPYPTRVLGPYGDKPVVVVLYATTVLALSVAGGLMRVHALRADLVTPSGRRELEKREHWLLGPAVFLLSIPIAFLSTTAALFSWCLLLVLPAVRRRRRASRAS